MEMDVQKKDTNSFENFQKEEKRLEFHIFYLILLINPRPSLFQLFSNLIFFKMK